MLDSVSQIPTNQCALLSSDIVDKVNEPHASSCNSQTTRQCKLLTHNMSMNGNGEKLSAVTFHYTQRRLSFTTRRSTPKCVGSRRAGIHGFYQPTSFASSSQDRASRSVFFSRMTWWSSTPFTPLQSTEMRRCSEFGDI